MLLYNARIVTPGGILDNGYVAVSGDTITHVGAGMPDATLMASYAETVDCHGDLLMPGAIDTHVHFREPGLTDKADIASESAAAVAGGVTSYCEMPNTRPATVTRAAWTDKMERAGRTSLANYAFYIGATTDNIDEIAAIDYARCPGVKIFLGSSTGNMLMEDDAMLRAIIDRVGTRIPLAFHAEDNTIVSEASARIRAAHEANPDTPVPMSAHADMRPRQACTEAAARVARLAAGTGARCVLLHSSTADEADMPRPDTLWVETCPQYLLFDRSDYDTLGARIKCNPAVKERADREALVAALINGRIDIVSTDHAPHLPADKQGDVFKATSGMPGVQFALPLMLTLTGDPALTARLMAANPAAVYGIESRGAIAPGMYADIVRLSHTQHTITDADVLSRCGWTPYAGRHTDYSVVTTWVNGHAAYDNGAVDSTNRAARALSFCHQ